LIVSQYLIGITIKLKRRNLQEKTFLIFFTNVNASELVFLITDKGHDNGWVFRFYMNEFMTFSKWYEEYFNRDFFQFSDYLVVFPSLNRIRSIDDEVELMKLIYYNHLIVFMLV